MSKVALTALFLATIAGSAAAQSRPVCPGGPFQGSVKPTRPPDPDDPRNCVATPTRRGTSVRSGGPRPAAGAGAPRLLSTGYHFAGAATVDATYTSVYGNLQVADVDLSGSGLSHVIHNFLFTPDYFNYIQTGWIDESYGTNYPRVFVEARVPGVDDRWYFDQYPLTPGSQYLFTVVSKPTSWYAMIWWGGTWNQLVSVAATPREGVEQEYLEIYTSNGVHPFVPQLLNTDSTLVYQDSLLTWDGGVATAPIADWPYCVSWLNPYYNWLAGSC